MKWKIVWERGQTPEEIWATGYQGYVRVVWANLLDLAQGFSDQVEVWMKANATWRDKTGQARANLFADAYQDAMKTVITFGHGKSVYYGWYLEYGFAGRYAIVTPALNFWIEPFHQALQRLFEK